MLKILKKFLKDGLKVLDVSTFPGITIKWKKDSMNYLYVQEKQINESIWAQPSIYDLCHLEKR